MKSAKINTVIALVAISGLVLCLAYGCRKGEAPEEKAAKEIEEAEPKHDNTLEGDEGIRNAVKGYNQAVIHANMREEYARFVRKYATEYEASRVVVFIQEDRTKGRVMRSKLAELVFDNISSSANMAAVRTREKWEFDYIDLQTGKLKEPMKEMTYRLMYTLIREDNRWLVGKLEQLEQPEVTVYSPPRAMEP